MKKKREIKKTIKRKLTQSYGFLVLFFVLIFIAFDAILALRLKEEGVDHWMKQNTDSIFQNIESLIVKSVRVHIKIENEKLLAVASIYSRMADEGMLLPGEARKDILNEISRQKMGESGYSYAIDSRGIMIVHPYEEYVNTDFSGVDVVQKQLSQRSGYLDYMWQNPGETEERHKTLFMTPFEPQDLIIATTAYFDDPTISDIRIDDVRQFIRNSPGLENSTVSLLDSEGYYLIEPEGLKVTSDRNTSILPYLDRIKETESGNFTIPGDSFPQLFSGRKVFYHYMPATDWIILTCGFVRDIYSLITNIILISFVIVSVSVIFLIYLNSMISRRLSQPLNRLVETIERGSEGDMSVRSDLKTGDELEIMGAHFNNFMDAQVKFVSDLKAAQKSIQLLARFPDETPNPVMRIGDGGILEYANRNACSMILPALNLAVGSPVPEKTLDSMVRKDNLIGRNEVSIGESLFSFTATRVVEPDGLYLFGRDITRQKKFESLQLLSENIYRNSIEGIVITDRNGIIDSINPAFTGITGYTEKDALGKKTSILKSHKHDHEFYTDMWRQLLKKGYWDGEIWNRRKDGTVYPEYLTITSLRDNKGEIQHFISFFHDLTEVKEKEDRIRYEATHDSLTGIPNKEYLYSRIQESIDDPDIQNLSVLYVDIRNLNRINESLGTDAGDALLIESARRLKGLFHDGVTVARLGSDDFAVLLNLSHDSPELQKTLDEILRIFHSVFVVKGKEIDIRISLGIAAYPDDDKDARELVAKAETAMRSSRDNVNNYFQFYNPGMKSTGLSRVELESSLRKAVEEKLFYLHYQPKVDARTGLITGSEALVRMHPVDGRLIGPDQFIPVAEEIGLIEALGAWVLERACRDTRTLHDQGFEDLTVAVNLSPWQFRRDDLPRQVENIVKSTGLPMNRLNLEITEGMAINNVDKSLEMMKKLTALGLSLSIDDFGTGYSSLSYMAEFPVDVLKIDKSFVKGIPDDVKVTGVALAILSLAQHLGMDTVAEGVETEEELNFFRDKGCDLIQGYYFHKPMTFEEYGNALRKDRSR